MYGAALIVFLLLAGKKYLVYTDLLNILLARIHI